MEDKFNHFDDVYESFSGSDNEHLSTEERCKRSFKFIDHLNFAMNVHLIVRTIDVEVTHPSYVLEDLVGFGFYVYNNGDKQDYKWTKNAKLIKKDDGQIYIRIDEYKDDHNEDILAVSDYGRHILKYSQF